MLHLLRHFWYYAGRHNVRLCAECNRVEYWDAGKWRRDLIYEMQKEVNQYENSNPYGNLFDYRSRFDGVDALSTGEADRSTNATDATGKSSVVLANLSGVK